MCLPRVGKVTLLKETVIEEFQTLSVKFTIRDGC